MKESAETTGAPRILRARLDKRKGRLPEHTYVRIYRSLSWLEAAAVQATAPDFRFVALWISFNALYGGSDFIAGTSTDKVKSPEKIMFKKFLSDLEDRNKEGLWKALSSVYESFIKNLIDNKYVYRRFWIDQYSAEGDKTRYVRHFRDDLNRARRAFAQRDLQTMMNLVFDRLYVLRNQLFHGAATHGGSLNRKQVDVGNKVLGALLPVMLKTVLDILESEPEYDRWGKLPYPPLDRPVD